MQGYGCEDMEEQGVRDFEDIDLSDGQLLQEEISEREARIDTLNGEIGKLHQALRTTAVG